MKVFFRQNFGRLAGSNGAANVRIFLLIEIYVSNYPIDWCFDVV